MKTINKPSDNLGGGLKLWAIPFSLVTSITGGVMTLSGTATIVEIYFTQGTLSLEHEHVNSKNDRAGGYHRHRITAFIPKLSDDVEIELEDLRNRGFVICMMDGNEQYWAVGNSINPLHFSYSSGTGADTHELNGYSIVFEGKTKTPPVFIDNPF